MGMGFTPQRLAVMGATKSLLHISPGQAVVTIAVGAILELARKMLMVDI